MTIKERLQSWVATLSNAVGAVTENLNPKQKAWLKGLEVAAGSALVTAFLDAPLEDLHHEGGWGKLIAKCGAVTWAAVRLYLAQSPVQSVFQLKEVDTAKLADGTEVSSSRALTTTDAATVVQDKAQEPAVADPAPASASTEPAGAPAAQSGAEHADIAAPPAPIPIYSTYNPPPSGYHFP